MLDAQKIENKEYCLNEVADLFMRLQIVRHRLEYAMTELYKIKKPDSLTLSAYEIIVNTIGMIDHEHDCEVKPDENGKYSCACGLRAPER